LPVGFALNTAHRLAGLSTSNAHKLADSTLMQHTEWRVSLNFAHRLPDLP